MPLAEIAFVVTCALAGATAALSVWLAAQRGVLRIVRDPSSKHAATTPPEKEPYDGSAPPPAHVSFDEISARLDKILSSREEWESQMLAEMRAIVMAETAELKDLIAQLDTTKVPAASQTHASPRDQGAKLG